MVLAGGFSVVVVVVYDESAGSTVDTGLSLLDRIGLKAEPTADPMAEPTAVATTEGTSTGLLVAVVLLLLPLSAGLPVLVVVVGGALVGFELGSGNLSSFGNGLLLSDLTTENAVVVVGASVVEDVAGLLVAVVVSASCFGTVTAGFSFFFSSSPPADSITIDLVFSSKLVTPVSLELGSAGFDAGLDGAAVVVVEVVVVVVDVDVDVDVVATAGLDSSCRLSCSVWSSKISSVELVVVLESSSSLSAESDKLVAVSVPLLLLVASVVASAESVPML